MLAIFAKHQTRVFINSIGHAHARFLGFSKMETASGVLCLRACKGKSLWGRSDNGDFSSIPFLLFCHMKR